MPSLPKKFTPRQRRLDALRKMASEDLAKSEGKPLDEKTRQDLATLEALDATKH